MARASSETVPVSTTAAPDIKRFEVALRLAQVCAAWAQVIGVIFAAAAAIYAINNNLLSIKNSELESANNTLRLKSEDLAREIGTREEALEQLKQQFDIVSESSRRSAEEARRLQVFAQDSAAAAKRSRELLHDSYRLALSEHIQFQAVADTLRRLAGRSSEESAPDSEGIYFDTEAPERSSLVLPDYVQKFGEILRNVRANPRVLGIEADSEAFTAVMGELEKEFNEHKSHLVCEAPDRDKWLESFKKELARATQMMNIAEGAKFKSYVDAYKWSERQKQQVLNEKWWLEEKESFRAMARDFWYRSVKDQYYSAWWGALSACKFNFERLSKIATGRIQPRTARDSELLPPIPMEDQEW